MESETKVTWKDWVIVIAALAFVAALLGMCTSAFIYTERRGVEPDELKVKGMSTEVIRFCDFEAKVVCWSRHNTGLSCLPLESLDPVKPLCLPEIYASDNYVSCMLETNDHEECMKK